MKVNSTNQVLILASERTPTRRRDDPRIASISAATRIDQWPATSQSTGYSSIRSSSLSAVQQYEQVQQMAQSAAAYGHIDLYA